MMKRFLACALAVLTALTLTACGGGAIGGYYSEIDKAANESAPQDSIAGWDDGGVEFTSDAVTDGTKMIYKASLDLETLDFDKAQQDIADLVKKYGGYYEEQTVSSYGSGYRYARYTIRVPAGSFEPFTNELGSVCHTVQRNSTQENVSEAYYDVESRLSTAKTKLARLQELLAKAEDLTDIITLEDAISETEQVIDSLSGTLRSYDRLVDFATVSVALDEVYRISGTGEAPLTLGQRLSTALAGGAQSVGEFFEGILVWLAYSWLWLILLAVAAAVVICLIRRGKRKKAKNTPQA